MYALVRDRLLAEMESLPTVDCHSHTSLRRDYYAAGPRTLFSLMAYFEREVQSVTGKGSQQLYASAKTDRARWRALKKVIGRARNTSYWRHNLITYRALFGLEDDELTDGNWQTVNERVKERTADPEWYDHVTRDVCRLRTQVRNIPWFQDWEPEYFTAVLRMEEALNLHERETRERLEKHLGCAIRDLASAKQALADLVDEYQERGAVGIKLAHAYGRTLSSEDVPEADAADIFRRALADDELGAAEVKALQDHIIFFLAALASKRRLVFQIHTGVQTNWGRISDSDPLHLLPLIHGNRKTRF
ncbi:MAG: hypothetical protein ACE5O2_04680, partial [Armatimonadota bacterium]